MKLPLLLLSTFFLFLFILISTSSANEPSNYHKLIFKPDGTNHCDSKPGIELTVLNQELSSKGIIVYSMRKGHDGREGIAQCGESTGQVNIYEIHSSDVPKAIELGYRELNEN